jgi:glutathione synthase/RimK-type ligase-like ATP-grasp enzyme
MEEIKATLKQCADIIRLQGMVRIDMLYANDQLYVNEINVIPGSLAMHLWKENMDIETLLSKMIRIGLKQYEQDKQLCNAHPVDFQLLHHKK